MTNFPLRIDSILKEQLKNIAKENKRSLNNQIEVILTAYVDGLSLNNDVVISKRTTDTLKEHENKLNRVIN